MRTVHKRWRDPQRRAPLAECALCGGELYPGERLRRIDGMALCLSCLEFWREVAGR